MPRLLAESCVLSTCLPRVSVDGAPTCPPAGTATSFRAPPESKQECPLCNFRHHCRPKGWQRLRQGRDYPMGRAPARQRQERGLAPMDHLGAKQASHNDRSKHTSVCTGPARLSCETLAGAHLQGSWLRASMQSARQPCDWHPGRRVPEHSLVRTCLHSARYLP